MSKFFREVISISQPLPSPGSEPRRLPKPPSLEELRPSRKPPEVAPAQPVKGSYPEGNSPPGVTHPEGDFTPQLKGRAQKVRRAVLAQDGHSAGEQSVYQALWNSATAETPETRVITIGFSALSKLCRLDKSNCKNNVRTLIGKLAIEVVDVYDATSNTGTTYRLFSYKEILRRRDAAQMVWVVRTCGVRFVHPEGNLPPGVTHPEGVSPTGPGGDLPPGPGGDLPPPSLELLLRKEVKELLLSAPVVQQALTEATGKIHDNDAALRCLETCREQSPDVSEEEVARLIHLKAPDCKGKPVVYLGKAVANHCSPETLKAHREKWGREEQQREAERARVDESLAEARAYWQKVLDDPNESEADKVMARRVLGG